MRMTSIFQSMTSDIGRCGLLAGVKNIPSLSGIWHSFPPIANPQRVRCTPAQRDGNKPGCVISVK
jgi:hypothetical protein